MLLLHGWPTIEKAPGGRRIPTGAGTDNGLHECNRMVKPLHHENGGLHFAALYGTLEAPNQSSRNRRLSCLPKVGKSSVHASAYISVPEVYPATVIIGRDATSSIREDWRLRLSRGALFPCLFSFNPKSIEASHVRHHQGNHRRGAA